MSGSSLDLAPRPIDPQFISGQEHVKRALEVAAAGGHPILITGTPGSGKTILARALPSLLPPGSMQATPRRRRARSSCHRRTAAQPPCSAGRVPA
jgi:magnesium chelatase family protein